ncbi:PaaI family thioesterase [Alicyclobacillus sp. SO9]|uniref:PaaI family thioesterase n=1 Tax=Alicyclobacillus sp. SO9 TaxID=2665646 RepID=UPI0018E83B3F|nr:PaaI family thioesterase [Alicyclobacillus sp. SO9]QQE80640.1 PaaI family thioesterase [Alicyclobacillus sp. SO9]
MLIDDILTELQDLPGTELQAILNLIRAKKDTYHRPLAFVQELMGFEFLNETENAFSYRMKVTDDLVNRYGLLHGGLTTAFLDTAMAETAFKIDNTIDRALTLNITVNFIRPGLPDDELVTHVNVIQNSRVMIVFQADVKNGEGDTLATAMAHFYKQHKRKKS